MPRRGPSSATGELSPPLRLPSLQPRAAARWGLRVGALGGKRPSVRPTSNPPHCYVPFPRRRLIISDGECFQQAMLATQLNEKVKSGEMVENCHIKLLNYLCQELQGKK